MTDVTPEPDDDEIPENPEDHDEGDALDEDD